MKIKVKEAGAKYCINCGEEIDQGHIEGTVEDVVKKYSDDIIDALELCQD